MLYIGIGGKDKETKYTMLHHVGRLADKICPSQKIRKMVPAVTGKMQYCSCLEF